MNKLVICIILSLFTTIYGISQNNITLSFTGQKTDGTWQQLDSVTVTNLDKGWDETLIYNDTVLILHTENGIITNTNPSAGIFPLANPFACQTSAEATLPGGKATAELYTSDGRLAATWAGTLPAGSHKFTISTASAQLYILKITSGNYSYSSKLICTEPSSSDKVELQHSKGLKNNIMPKGDCTLPFSKGDNMSYTGYCVQGSIPQTVTVEYQQWEDALIPLIFPKIAPKACPENPTLTDVDGNIYNTVLIGKQCWMRENLKVEHYADSTPLPLGNDSVHDHSIPFYFKYANSDSLANIYGMLYTWTAAMRDLNDTNAAQVQGICPDGWHLPSDEEWCEMTSTLAPQSSCYDVTPYFGEDDYLARTISLPAYWVSDNFTVDGMPGYWSTSPLYFNSSDFSAIPAGYYEHGAFIGIDAGTYWWTTKPAPNEEAYCRYLQYNNKGMNRNTKEICHGFSIRCIMN